MKPLLTCMAALLLAAPVLADDAKLGPDVVVRQNGVELTFAEIDARMNEIPAKDRDGFIDNPQRIESTLRQLLLIEQLSAQAREKGLDKDAKFIARRDLMEKRLLAEMRMAQIESEAPKADGAALAAEAYLVDPKQFNQPESVTVRHILVSTQGRLEAEARAQAEKLRGELVAGKASFEDMAKQFSEDRGSANRGGLIENIRTGMTEKPFEEAAFSLKQPGELSPIVQTPFGFHIIQLVSRQEAKPLSQDEVVKAYASKYEANARRRYRDDRVAEMQSAPLQADEARVASLRDRYDADTAAAKDDGKQ